MTDDVLLITRRNEDLYGIMRGFVVEEEVKARREGKDGRGKGKKGTGGAGRGRPKGKGKAAD